MQFSIVGNDDGDENITVFLSGRGPLVAHSSHPNFERIREGALNRDESIADLFDVAQTVATKFERLSDRVTMANGRLYLDGVEVDNVLTKQVIRYQNEGVQDWRSLVNFFENVQANPNEHSREQLFEWLDRRDFTITPDGMIVGYKGVRADNGEFTSINTGTAIVDGEVKTGAIPNYIGAVVEMPRNQVQWDPSEGCSTGLHVGSYRYADSFSQGALLEVHVNPRDVVSVPTDSDWEKMRVCRYVVVNTIDNPYTSPLTEDSAYEYEDEECNCGSEYCCGIVDCECHDDYNGEDDGFEVDWK